MLKLQVRMSEENKHYITILAAIHKKREMDILDAIIKEYIEKHPLTIEANE